MGIKEKLLELVDEAHRVELAVRSTVTEAERAATGTPEVWSVRDVIAHALIWQNRMVDNFATAARGDPLPTYGEDDDENAKIYAAHHLKSWDEIRQMIDDAHARLAGYIQSASEDDLVDPERSVLKNHRALWTNIAGTAITHSLLHLAQWYAEHGHQAVATPMQEKIARMLIALGDAPEWRSTTIYNLACYYALSGQKALAITKLGEALTLNPGLTEWSTQDRDLASIREEAGYKALYA